MSAARQPGTTIQLLGQRQTFAVDATYSFMSYQAISYNTDTKTHRQGMSQASEMKRSSAQVPKNHKP